MRRYRTDNEPKPWIEQLIQNYGKSPREISLRAHVVGVSDLSESQRTDESDACMLFLSDGTVFIPAVLSAAAWERLQELEERETFSGLDNTTVSVRKFQLNFHMDPELTSCQFYLIVNQIVTVERVTRHYHPPSCTTLPSVRHQILKTWRSLMKECSVSSMNSQSGLQLSCLMGAWHNDIIMNVLNDAIKKISPHIMCHQGIATPTHWHLQRLCGRAEGCFNTPVSHLLIPEDQRKLLTADPSASNMTETLSGLVPVDVDKIKNHTSIQAIDQERDSSAGTFDQSGNGDLPTLGYTRPEVCCSGGEAGGERKSPWDMFCPASDVLETPTSTSENSIEPHNQQDSQSLLTELVQVSTATPTQAQTYSPSTEEAAGSVTPPSLKPHPTPHSTKRLSDKTATDLNQKKQEKQHILTQPMLIAKTRVLSIDENLPIDTHSEKKHTVSPPAKKGRVHSDGSLYSYTYESCPQVASALAQLQVPEQLVQWAVAYLGTPHHALYCQH